MTADYPVNQAGSDPALREAERQSAIETQLRLLASRNPRLRADAARRLGQLRAEPAALLEALDDPNGFVRSAAAIALGYIAGPLRGEVIDALLAAIDDPNDYVTSAAIRSLGRLQATEARDQIVPFLDDANQAIVSASILTLAQLDADDLAERLAAFLDSDNPYICLAAVRAVGILNYTHAAPQLLALLDESLTRRHNQVTTRLPKTIIETLARLSFHDAIPRLTSIAQHEVGLRSAAVQALIDLGADSISDQLAHMFADPSSALRESLIRMMIQSDYRPALPAIRPLLKDAKMPIRQAALDVISNWHDLAAIDQVRWMCHHDPSPHLRPHAVATLTRLAGYQALPDLLVLAVDLNTAVRRAVAISFGEIKPLPESAAIALHQLTADADAHVAEAARNSLNRHSLSPGNGRMPPPTVSPRVPDELTIVMPTLLTYLQRWQTSLATRPTPGGLADIAEIDSALTTLITALRQASADTEIG